MVVIYGQRYYGEIESYGGQRLLTKFVHVYYLPVAPVSSIWVTGVHGRSYHGHMVPLSTRSVIVGYARMWAPVVAIGMLLCGASAGPIGIAVAGVAALACIALWAQTWRWREPRGARARLRSDFHLSALGTRCDPMLMDHQLASHFQARVAERWAEVANGKTPEDVSRLGAENPTQAALAYASLRLAARLASKEEALAAHEAGERILSEVKDRPPGDGPYRSAPSAAA